MDSTKIKQVMSLNISTVIKLSIMLYSIVRNFGELAIIRTTAKLKTWLTYVHVRLHVCTYIHTQDRYLTYEYFLETDSPNLMFARYTYTNYTYVNSCLTAHDYWISNYTEKNRQQNSDNPCWYMSIDTYKQFSCIK